MGKTIPIPTGITFATIDNHSDIGTLSDNVDGTFDASNITTTMIRNVLGESTNAVGVLSTSPNINRWSLFKPDRNKVDLANNEVIYSPASPYPMGEFLGYDHDAPVDYVSGSGSNESYPPTSSGAVITGNWVQNQMSWGAELAPDGVNHLILLLKQDGSVVRKAYVALEDRAGSHTYHCEITGVPAGSYTAELWFGDNGGSGLSEHTLLAKVPDTNWQWSITVTELSEPSANLITDYDDPAFDGYTLVDEGTSVDVDENYLISFHFEGGNPDIYDGKIYYKVTGGDWKLLESGQIWTFGNQSFSYSGTIPDDVDYGDTVYFMLTTLVQGDAPPTHQINSISNLACNLDNDEVKLDVEVVNSYDTDSTVGIEVEFSLLSDFSDPQKIQTVTASKMIMANMVTTYTISAAADAIFNGEQTVYARARLTSASDSKDYNGDWTDSRSADVVYTNGYVDPTFLDFAYDGATAQTVDVTTFGDWTASPSDSWINVIGGSGTDGGSFDVDCDYNTGNARTGYVTVTTPYDTFTIQVDQGEDFGL